MAPVTTPRTAPAPALPSVLAQEADRLWADYRDAAQAAGQRIPDHPDFVRSLRRVWAFSSFVAHACIRDPALPAALLESGELLGDFRPGEYPGLLDRYGKSTPLETRLRRFRRRHMVRIAWRDLAGWASLEETLRDLSGLAEACLDLAVQGIFQALCREWGTPRGADGMVQRPVVLGMGKLGAGELNLSSDIDLIFAYPEDGVTRRRRGLSHGEFFARLVQGVAAALGAVTGEGFAFRVDLRLRPFGDSGPLAMSFDQMEEYYQLQGREWERYAFIKAGPVAGDRAAGARLLAILKPFVYRRYLDYGTFESLREMKALIVRQVQRRGLVDNVKLGPGGIREVEFIGQAFQLIRGGREPALQQRAILPVLRVLEAKGWLPTDGARALRQAYRFLRRVENRLQSYEDLQTHALPGDEAGRWRLALSMGFPDWPAFWKVLTRHRTVVAEQFAQVFAAPQRDAATAPAASERAAVWSGALSGADAQEALRRAGYPVPEEAIEVLAGLRDGHARRVGAQGAERLDRLMPMLLGAAGAAPHPAETLRRVVGVVESVVRRSAYLALLVESPLALSQLVRLCAASPWIAAYVAAHPLLLDQLLDPRALYAPMPRPAQEAELDALLAQTGPDDLEQQMEVLRQFKHAQGLHVAAAEVTGALPLMVVSDRLTELAEVILNQVLRLAWDYLVARHGLPRYRSRGRQRHAGFAVIAYGKLGGIELGHGSDLDLVFIHDSHGEEQQTAGPRVVDNGVFFARLGQRIIHFLSAHTPGGVLYPVDTRLRPSGASGLLVTALEAFADYQHNTAWTWEHQALVRARPVAGDPAIARTFAAIRRAVLSRARDQEGARRDVVEMRARMRRELGSRDRDRFDLKQDPGGIADIEFMVQYGVLAWAQRYPELLAYTDNVRLLELLARVGVLPKADAAFLADAYRTYRSEAHRLTLQQEPAVVDGDRFGAERDGVLRLWGGWLEGGAESA
ncbi:MAG: bifunctional glutamine synthetase adenylyltransferase/deadenyltransferase [Chromatiales bacterium 21-64-14]|nr:MAG: bifunctional glutamine synthetase adenylyltransferase/deadenyltransferase [Chromatiales bacterium 21-64-14]HQU15298.1 bifunctional [glutamate--ammonia ligase]-adenylyl-L-tyrosine phosphorylase/[glutamate--ammonia-ligase] adenylyltransferase [Gammaproteobacteria bacterium]